MKNILKNLFLKEEDSIYTEPFFEFGIWNMEWHPVITELKKDKIIQYYLFDYLKIWQRKINR